MTNIVSLSYDMKNIFDCLNHSLFVFIYLFVYLYKNKFLKLLKTNFRSFCIWIVNKEKKYKN